MPTITLRGNRIDYMVTRGTSSRYTYFRFGPGRTLRVVVPRGARFDLDSAIRSRQDWILRELGRLSRSPHVFDGETLMFGGQSLDIEFQESHDGESLQLDLPAGRVVARAGDRSRVKELVRRLFLKETSAYVMRRLSEVPRSTGEKYHRADVREISNWGYCTRTGRLSFSWQLIALPESLRDYVIFHELAHLSHFNHSRAFRQRLAELCPAYRERERELFRVVPMETPGAAASRF